VQVLYGKNLDEPQSRTLPFKLERFDLDLTTIVETKQSRIVPPTLSQK
jgi:hypothetical protein